MDNVIDLATERAKRTFVDCGGGMVAPLVDPRQIALVTFESDSPGIALVSAPDVSAWWMTTDQAREFGKYLIGLANEADAMAPSFAKQDEQPTESA